MEKYLAAALLTVSFSAHSTVVSHYKTICTNPTEFAQTMTNYGEMPLVRGDSKRVLEDTPFEATLVIFMNPKTRTFTVAEKINEETICVIGMGEGFEPLDEEGNSLEEKKEYKGT